MKLWKLFTEWYIHIKIFAKSSRIPCITVKCFIVVNWIWFPGRILAKYDFSGSVTFSEIHASWISECKPSFHPFFWAQCWWGDLVFFPIKHRRDLIHKILVFISHKKLLARNSAFFCFDNFLSRRNHTQWIMMNYEWKILHCRLYIDSWKFKISTPTSDNTLHRQFVLFFQA